MLLIFPLKTTQLIFITGKGEKFSFSDVEQLMKLHVVTRLSNFSRFFAQISIFLDENLKAPEKTKTKTSFSNYLGRHLHLDPNQFELWDFL